MTREDIATERALRRTILRCQWCVGKGVAKLEGSATAL